MGSRHHRTKAARQRPRRGFRATLLGVLALSALALSGCATNNQAERFGMPVIVSKQGQYTLHLWQGAWIAALCTGIIVWGLIFYVCIRYRRRSDADIPVQTRYNLPLEIFYTIAPVLMVIVFFFHTVKTQDAVLNDNIHIDNTVEVTGQQWTWTFNYGIGPMNESEIAGPTNVNHPIYPYSSYVYDAGTASHFPTLELPVNETTRFNLHSPDVIHDFGVPQFAMRMDVIPGRVNHYNITPTKVGWYRGACYELCGVYHSRMLFNVHVVSKATYQAYLQKLQQEGFTAQKPLIGGQNAYVQAGLDTTGAGQ